jgi:septum formation protein
MIILASNSPRRRQLLGLAGWEYKSAAAPVDERLLPGEFPDRYVLRLALAKAQATLAAFPAHSGDLVVAADTAVVDGEQIMGKPDGAAEAERMLRQLRGRRHQVFTGLAVLRAGDSRLHSQVVITDVWMRAYTDVEMQAYIASGDPLDKAGAYAIQHAQFQPVTRLEGCAANVVGLPVCRLATAVQALGGASPGPAAQTCMAGAGQTCAMFDLLAAANEAAVKPAARQT